MRVGVRVRVRVMRDALLFERAASWSRFLGADTRDGPGSRVVSVSPSIVPFLYSKRTAAARSLVSRNVDDRSFCPVFK